MAEEKREKSDKKNLDYLSELDLYGLRRQLIKNVKEHIL